MSTDLRQRRPAAPATSPSASAPEVDESKTKVPRAQHQPPNLEPDLWVVLTLFFSFAAIVITYYFYRVSYAEDGAFAEFVNTKILRENDWASQMLLVYPKTKTLDGGVTGTVESLVQKATRTAGSAAGKITAA
ncbi:hypothetical protein B0A48_03718 [Cryoendolithus antarcticus]|uniref:Uncharacterized protein n=1 Tax=Cryoendolithus antarcticus TaxID=1507870 RepID=A0A1V8TGT0_9PEZI|nr:hypothetical protein B0A48_03718 [Cryoendolithus antarcticus]